MESAKKGIAVEAFASWATPISRSNRAPFGVPLDLASHGNAIMMFCSTACANAGGLSCFRS